METNEASESMSRNRCCTHVKEKYSKLIASRNALREAVKILQQQIDVKESENVNLQKEITSLKAEITHFQQKRVSKFNFEEDNVKTFDTQISKEEKQIAMLKVQLDIEKKKAGPRAEYYKRKLTSLEKDACEAKAKLVSETCSFQNAIRRLEFEKQELLREKRLAELEISKLQEQKKLSDSYKKNAHLFSKHLNEYTKHIEEGEKQLEDEKQKVIREMRCVDTERVRAHKQKKLAEVNLKKTMAERDSVVQLSEQLRKEKLMVEDLKKKIHDLSSSAKLVHESGIKIDMDRKAKGTEMKLLKKQLRFEKMRVKHAKRRSKLEANCHQVLQQELGRLKLDFIQFMERLNILELSLSNSGANADDRDKAKNNVDMEKSNYNRERTDQIHRDPEELLDAYFPSVDACDSTMTSMQCTVPHLDLTEGNSTHLISGTESKLKPLTGRSYRKIIQSCAIKSNPASFSDAKLMGSQDRGALSVLASANLGDKNFTSGAVVSHISHEVTKLMSIDASISGHINTSHFTSEGDNKGLNNRKRKRSPKTKIDKESARENDRVLEEDVTEVLNDKNACGNPHLIEIGSVLETTSGLHSCPACPESEFDVIEIEDGNYMKLLDLDADEEIYQRATDKLLSPTLPEVKCLEEDTAVDKLIPLSDEISGEELCSIKEDILALQNYDAIDAETKSSTLQVSTSRASNNVQHCNMPVCSYSGIGGEYYSSQVSDSDLVTSNVPDYAFPEESETKIFQDGISRFFIMFPDTKDPSINSRIVVAARNCIARCRLDTETEWAAGSILLALKSEKNVFPKETVSVLLSLLLLNFSIVSETKFGELSNGNIMSCSDSYAQHIWSETGILSEEWGLLDELLCLIEDFLICGKAVVCNNLESATLTELSHSGAFVPLSSKTASSEQIVGCSIILASICAAFDHIEFICEASCNVLLMCGWESSMVLMILHIFSHLGGEKLFNSRKYTLAIMVLKSIVMFLEDERSSEASLCPEVNCSFYHKAASVDVTASVLLEKLSNIAISTNIHQEKMDSRRSSHPNVLLDNDKAEESTCIDEANWEMASGMPGCMKSCLFCATSSKDLQNRWEWTSAKVVPRLLKILDSCLMDDIAVAVVTLLGTLGRLGIDASGFDSKEIMDLRLRLVGSLCQHTAENAYPPLRVAILQALLGLTSFDLETLLKGGSELPNSLSAEAEIIKKYFSQLTKDEEDLFYDLLRSKTL